MDVHELSAMDTAAAQSRAQRLYEWKAFRTFCLVRALLGSGAVATHYSMSTSGARLGLEISLAYALVCLGGLVLARGEKPSLRLQIRSALLVDLTFVIALVTLSGGVASGFSMLYFLPVAGSALLASRRGALFVAGVATLALLIDSWSSYPLRSNDVSLFQAGSLGAAMIAVSFVLNDLARRVGVQERLALAKNAQLQAQIETNRLVIRDMPQGVLVVMPDGEVRAANPAACAILGVRPDARIDRLVLEAHPMLSALLSDWSASPRQIPRSRDIVINASPMSRETRSLTDTLPLSVRPRILRVKSIPNADDTAYAPMVVYLEDLREVEAQAVQLKLASMGRLSASIAHEIRNPLAAIGHASALLSEESTNAASARLVRIIEDNVKRLDRIVGDVLSVSRSSRVRSEPLNLSAAVRTIVDDFLRGAAAARNRITVDVPAQIVVVFDRTHLGQILDNLIANAIRYASEQDGAVEIVADASPGGEVAISVSDDGPGVSPESRAQLFEPFFTTHRKGTGLGLYLARELALANRATLFLDQAQPRVRGACFTLRISAPNSGILASP